MLLVCEGPCNPDLRAQDDTIFDIRETQDKTEDERIPALKIEPMNHTDHIELSKDIYSCGTCGTVRRFGNTV